MTYTPQQYSAKDYSFIKNLKGISDLQIEEHIKLYNGYVNRTNALLKKLADLTNEGKQGDSSFQELKRRMGWEFNGMRLHELYFDQMTSRGEALTEANPFGNLVTQQYGSIEAWKEDLMGSAKMPGIGWVICFQDLSNGQLINTWIEQHDGGHLAGANPVLVLDCFEHAFSVYLKPTQRAQYLEDLFLNIDWNIVAGRIAG